jgi:hypothetical protein
MRHPALRLVLALAAALLVAACASTSIRSAWFDAGYTGGPFKKILVVGVHGTTADTRVFEDIFAQKLKVAGVDGVPGYQVLPAGAAPGDPVWNAAVEATGADGLLAVRLLRVDTRTQVNTMIVPGPMAWGPYGGWWGPYGGWWGPGMVAMPQVTQYEVASVETNLWDVQTRRVVWAASTDTFNPASVQQETPGFANLIIGQLAARGLVPGPAK